jgi:hypothetical protein
VLLGGIVEEFDIIERVSSGLIAGAVCFAGDPFGFERRDPKGGVVNKLSIAALSQTLPDRLIEQVTPLSVISR